MIDKVLKTSLKNEPRSRRIKTVQRKDENKEQTDVRSSNAGPFGVSLGLRYHKILCKLQMFTSCKRVFIVIEATFFKEFMQKLTIQKLKLFG